MKTRRLVIALVPLFFCASVFGRMNPKLSLPKNEITILKNGGSSHISIETLDGERKGLSSHGEYELLPGKHTIRVRLHYSVGRVIWESNNLIDYSFNAEAGAILKVVCIETRDSQHEGTWKVRVEDEATGKDATAYESNRKAWSPGKPETPAAPIVEDLQAKAIHSEAETQYDLGFSYEQGEGVPQDLALAAKSYQKSAELGFVLAQRNLGKFYDQGKGVQQNHAEALKWYLKAAEQGNSEAQYLLGLSYDSGQGVPQNYAEAAKWFRVAAEQGETVAQFHFGNYCAQGRGIQQDYVEAAQWYQKAAEQGHAAAQCNLGLSYDLGRGVKQDYSEAYVWFSVSAAGGEPKAAQLRDDETKKLTPQALEQGQARALQLQEEIKERTVQP